MVITIILVFASYTSINSAADKAKTILAENYASIAYVERMISYLDDIHDIHLQNILNEKIGGKNTFLPGKGYERAVILFQNMLQAAKKNISEKGENEVLLQLESNFNGYLKTYREVFNKSNRATTLEERFLLVRKTLLPAYTPLRGRLLRILEINMTAVVKKNQLLQRSTNLSSLFMVFLGFIAVIFIGALFFFSPNFIIEPIKTILVKLQNIEGEDFVNANQSIKTQITELGYIDTSLNDLSKKLEFYSKSSLSQLRQEKKHTEAIIQVLKDILITRKAIILLDQNKVILYINHLMLELMHLKEEDVVGEHASTITTKNDLFNSLMYEILMREADSFQGREKIESLQLEIDKEKTEWKKYILDIKSSSRKKDRAELIGFAIVLEKA